MTVTEPSNGTNVARSRFVGGWPKIGIRPAIDGRRRGVRESLEDQTMGDGPRDRRAPQREPAPPGRQAGRVRHRRHLHRRRRRGRRGGARNSRARASASRSPSRRAGATAPRRWTWTRSCPRPSGASTAPSGRARSISRRCSPAHNQKGLPAFGIYGRDVQDAGDASIPADVEEKLLRFARAGPGRRDHARQVATSRSAACRWASPARSSTSRSSSSYLGHARRERRHVRVHPPHRGGDLRRGGVRARARLGEGQLQGGQGPQRTGPAGAAARRRIATGRRSSR